MYISLFLVLKNYRINYNHAIEHKNLRREVLFYCSKYSLDFA